MRRWWPYLFFAICALVPLALTIVHGNAIGAFDQIRTMAPWNGPKPSSPWDVLAADGVLQFYPWRDMVLSAWGKGELPLWNPYELGGTPLLANSQSAGFYPLHIVFGLVHMATPTAMLVLAWFHLFIAGLGTYLLANKLGASRISASLGGASFALSLFMVGWTLLPSVTTTVCWLPLGLSGVVGLTRAENSLDLRKSSFLVATTVALLLLGGHLQFAVYSLMGLGIFGACNLIFEPATEKGMKVLVRTLLSLGAVILGIGLAAPQLLPVTNYSQFSHRKNAPSAEGYSAYLASSIQPFEIANLISPVALGSPREAIDIANNQTISSYWVPFVKRGANLTESATCIGPLVFGLMLVAPWRERRTWAISAVGIFGLLLALGTPLNAVLYFALPGWSSTGSPNRAVFLFVLSACVLAALGFERLVKEPKKSLFLTASAAPLAVGIILAIAAPSIAPAAIQGSEEVVSALKGSALMPAVISTFAGSIFAGLAIALTLPQSPQKYLPAVALLPLVIAWQGFASHYILNGQPLSPFSLSDDGGRTAVINDNWDILTGVHALLPPNTLSLSRVPELGGYDSLLHRDTVGLLHNIDGQDPAPPANGNMMFVKTTANPKLLADAGVTRVVSTHPLPALGQATATESFFEYAIPGPGRLSAKGGKATISEDGFDRQIIETEAGVSEVIVRDRWMPGWELNRGGRLKELGLWRQIKPNSGPQRLVLRYNSPGLRTGILIGFVSFMIWIAIALICYLPIQMGSRAIPEES